MLSLLASATASALALTAIGVWRTAAPVHRFDLICAPIAGAAFFLLRAAPDLTWLMPLVLTGPMACNRGLRAGFDLGQRPWRLDAALLAVLLVTGIMAYMGPHSLLAARLYDLAALLLFCEPLALIALTYADDMVEGRRQARFWLLAAGAAIGPLIALGNIMGYGQWAVTLGAAATLTLCLLVAAFGAPRPQIQSARVRPATLDAREDKTLHRLRSLMHDEAVWRDPNLTLTVLARRLEIPEHRLRRIIHLGEGQRNFSAWLNLYRLGAIKIVLSDPARRGETLLSLATDAGYNSLSAFNRAFRAVEGLSPSAWRKARLTALTAKVNAASDASSDTAATTGRT